MVVFLWLCFFLLVFLWWCFCGGVFCGGVFVVVFFFFWCFLWWCFCGGVFCGGVFLWWCFCGGVFHGGVFCGGVFVVVFFVVVFLWWCFFLLVFLWWCFLWWCFLWWCFLWWCFCGGVFHGGVFCDGVFVVVWLCFCLLVLVLVLVLLLLLVLLVLVLVVLVLLLVLVVVVMLVVVLTASVHTLHMSKKCDNVRHVQRTRTYFTHVQTCADCFGTYITHVQTCDNVRVQSATQWTASVHTLQMSKLVITFVFKVLRNGLLRFILYKMSKLVITFVFKVLRNGLLRSHFTHAQTCDNLRVQHCYAMDCFGTYIIHVQKCDNVRFQSATQWTASELTLYMSKNVITFVFKVLRNGLLRYILYTCEVAPKFNCCKMEYLSIVRFKGPLRFSMFRTCLSRKLAWPCVFLSGLRDFSCRAPFWRPCTFACVPVNFFNRFLSLRCSTVTLRGGSACMFLRLIGLNEATPCKSEKS